MAPNRLRWPDGVSSRVGAAAVVTALVVVLYQLRGAWIPITADGSLREKALGLGVRSLCYVALPVLVARGFGLGATELGLRLTNFRAYARRSLPLYLGLYVAMLPLLWLAAGTAPFQRAYPQCKQAADGLRYLLAWWAIYGGLLFAVELFYRGFLLGMLREPLGRNAIAVSMMVYAIAHSGKPLGEALGAIVTGSLLGWLAYEGRSIWLGWGLHCAVAFTLEALVLARR